MKVNKGGKKMVTTRKEADSLIKDSSNALQMASVAYNMASQVAQMFRECFPAEVEAWAIKKKAEQDAKEAAALIVPEGVKDPSL